MKQLIIAKDKILDITQNRANRFSVIIIMIIISLVVLKFNFFKKNVDKKIEQNLQSVLTVNTTKATTINWPKTIETSGLIAAWQEAIISSEISDQRLTKVLVNVGDKVKKNQVLAIFNLEKMLAERDEVMASFRQAKSDYDRAYSLKGSGAISEQQIEAYSNQATIAKARLEQKNFQLRYAKVISPDNGVISSRTATVGSVVNPGSELFRIILNNHLEWRGELTPFQLSSVSARQEVLLTLPDNSKVRARVRNIAPALDPQSRMAILYADLESDSKACAGMYVNGEVTIEKNNKSIVIPAAAVVTRDGYTYVFKLSPNVKVTETTEKQGNVTKKIVTTTTIIDDVKQVAFRKVTIGRYKGNQVEILDGLIAGDEIVTSGAGFLNDGDQVLVASDPGAKR